MFVFDTSNNIDRSNTKKVHYDYYNTTINQSEIIYAQPDSSYNLQVAFVQSSSNPNFIYPDATESYKTTNLRIYSLIHNNIVNVTCYPNGQWMKTNIVGEMVIEHSQITGSNKLYTCFLLTPTDTSNTYTEIDDILNLKNSLNENTLTVNLNNIIQPPNQYIIYTSGYNTVVVFTKPIVVNVASRRILESFSNHASNLFSSSPSDQISYISLPNTTSENFQGHHSNGHENHILTSTSTSPSQGGQTFHVGDDAYIQCTPTGESAEQVSTMNVPINSEYVRDAGKLDFMKTTIQMCFVLLFLIGIYFSVPVFYKSVVIDSVNKFVSESDQYAPENNLLVRIRSADVLFTFLCFIIFVTIVTYNPNDFNMTMIGLYFAILFGLSYSTIQFKKLIPSFLQTKTISGMKQIKYPPENIDPEKQPNFFHFIDIYRLLSKSVDFVLFGNQGYNIISIFISFILTMVILLIFYSFRYMRFGTVWNLLMYITLLGIVPIVPMIGLIMKKE